MKLRRSLGWLTAGLVGSLGWCWLAASSEPGPRVPDSKPRLAVLIVFDQLRGDYPARWQELFVKDGFRRFQTEGAWFQNCHYPYSDTITAPGHASVATGCSPHKHGIIANDWYDRVSGQRITSVQSERHGPIPPPAGGTRLPGVAPLRRRQPTIGDSLHAATKGKGRVVSLSIKDRAAILLAALRAQICCWFSTTTGMFMTSTYYSDRLPGFVADFNRTRLADQWFETSWTRLHGQLDYARYSGPDDDSAEGTGYEQGVTFPHPLNGGQKKISPSYYKALTTAPQGNELLLALAKKAIDAEQLGQREDPDLLCLSFSCNDTVGHCWGPDSQEVLDLTLRTDLLIKELLDHLDARVGKGKYIVVISADHGVCPIPEVAQRQGKKAGRVPPSLLTSQAAAFLDGKFAKNGAKLPWIEETAGTWIYLNQGLLREQGLDAAVVEKALADWLAAQPGIQAAYTRSQLRKGPLTNDPLHEAVRLSFHAECSGDVTVVLQPYHLLSPPLSSKMTAYRTSHGSPHPYDTHVPLLVYGAGVRAGVRQERVTPQTAAVILARGLGMEPPSGAEVAVPDHLFQR
jgi:hypothetical protein